MVETAQPAAPVESTLTQGAPKDFTNPRSNNIMIEVVRKTKKNEPKYFKALCQIDRDAFDKHEDSGMMIKTFWKSNVNKIIVAKKKDT